MKKFTHIIIGSLFILSASCTKNSDACILYEVLNLGGDNRVEQETVLSRYSLEDSPKYRAACFLIEHMPLRRAKSKRKRLPQNKVL